jgi:ferredoxin
MLAACAIRTDDCQSCGQCLEACREHAIHKDSSLRSEADPRVSAE